ncbi:MAG TPA: LacI family DNA-binding transcriptional regulator [Galbitalea sp.]|jgi:DNA-binding LacI/PurR family transcriptional regulator|nr:LacI family DNA-binding transcriptional regulator [Galbitalea sp.]
MDNLPTVLDVGRVAGVSRQTVSNVLNSPDVVKPETRARVEAAIAQLGYRPHASARRLRTRRSSTIGIRLDPMTNGISGSVHDRFLHSLTEKADDLGLRVMLFTATDPQDEIRQIRRLHEGSDVDAFVLTSTMFGDPRTQWLVEHDIPFVTFGRPWGIDDLNDPHHRWVDVDGRTGLRLATAHLLAEGDRRVVYLGWPSPSGTGDDRRRGWRDEMEFSGRLSNVDLDSLQLGVSDGVAEGREAIRDLIEAGTAFDAIVCASDSLALGALLMVGPDIPVIGYDNTPVAQAVGLSSVEQPLDEVAEGVLELILKPSGSPGADATGDSRHRLVEPRLVVRHRRIG